MRNNAGVTNNMAGKWIIIAEIKNMKMKCVIKVFKVKGEIEQYYRNWFNIRKSSVL